VSIRSKLLSVVLVFGIAPMLLVSIFNYVMSVRAVEGMLRDEVERSATRITRGVEESLAAHEAEVLKMARTTALRDYVRESWLRSKTGAGQANGVAASSGVSAPFSVASEGEGHEPSPQLKASLNAFYLDHRNVYQSVTCLDAERAPLFRIEGVQVNENGLEEARFQTKDFVTGNILVNQDVWTTSQPVLSKMVAGESSMRSMLLTAPVFVEMADGSPRGALVVELNLASLFKQAEAGYASPDNPTSTLPRRDAEERARPSRLVVALDAQGYTVYQTSFISKSQKISDAMPFFKPIAERMRAGENGSDFFEDRAADGQRWLAAFRPVKETGISVAVAGDYTESVGGLRRAGLSGVALLLLAALVAAVFLIVTVGRTAHRIERVAAGAAAIAGGALNQRIDIQTSDETHVLAESFNRMSDRLREQITREAESRQFESFMRLSAMLTHDLKNSITALSMLVSNMEKQFHREEFRADAILSLREATDKLRRIVSRLSEPVKSLSGEYRRDARPTDLVPIIRRIVASTAEPSAPLYKIDLRLPESLVAFVEEGRIENVIENLVINALEAMGAGGGRLTIEAGEEPSGMVYFTVEDTGVGMSEEFIRERLFHAFSTTKNKGIGLGLFTCREIVEVHGGRLDVESQPGVGTRFRVVLPSQPFTLRERLRQSQKSGASSAERNV
jgi:signal transduction histidine kinase